MGSIAWGDESIRAKGLDRPVYLLAASRVLTGEQRARELLDALKPRHARKLHWRDMDTSRRALAITAIGTLDAAHTVIVGTRTTPAKTERARRQCLERLLPLLEQDGVTTYCMESRGKKPDQRDISLINAMRSSGRINTDVVHLLADSDPLLWIPDQILGAYGDMLMGAHEYDGFITANVLEDSFVVR